MALKEKLYTTLVLRTKLVYYPITSPWEFMVLYLELFQRRMKNQSYYANFYVSKKLLGPYNTNVFPLLLLLV